MAPHISFIHCDGMKINDRIESFRLVDNNRNYVLELSENSLIDSYMPKNPYFPPYRGNFLLTAWDMSGNLISVDNARYTEILTKFREGPMATNLDGPSMSIYGLFGDGISIMPEHISDQSMLELIREIEEEELERTKGEKEGEE